MGIASKGNPNFTYFKVHYGTSTFIPVALLAAKLGH